MNDLWWFLVTAITCFALGSMAMDKKHEDDVKLAKEVIELQKKCEWELPRNESCIIIAIPEEKAND